MREGGLMPDDNKITAVVSDLVNVLCNDGTTLFQDFIVDNYGLNSEAVEIFRLKRREASVTGDHITKVIEKCVTAWNIDADISELSQTWLSFYEPIPDMIDLYERVRTSRDSNGVRLYLSGILTNNVFG